MSCLSSCTGSTGSRWCTQLRPPARSRCDLGEECARPSHQLRGRHVVAGVQRLPAWAGPARARPLHVHHGRQRLAIVYEPGVVEEIVGLGLPRAGVGLGAVVGAREQSLRLGIDVVVGEVGIRRACLLAGADVGEPDATGLDRRPVHDTLVGRHVNAAHREPERGSSAQGRSGPRSSQRHRHLPQKNLNSHQRTDHKERAPPQPSTGEPRHMLTVPPLPTLHIRDTPLARRRNHLTPVPVVAPYRCAQTDLQRHAPAGRRTRSRSRPTRVPSDRLVGPLPESVPAGGVVRDLAVCSNPLPLRWYRPAEAAIDSVSRPARPPAEWSLVNLSKSSKRC